MILQKKQVHLNKQFSKYYKKLKYMFFNKTKNISAFKGTTITGNQSISILLLTINTISNNDYASIIDATLSNELKKTTKAILVYEGKSTIPIKSIRFISTKSLSLNSTLKSKNNIIDNILGTDLCIYKYKLIFNCQLSLQNLSLLKYKQKIKLKHLDSLATSLIVPNQVQIKPLMSSKKMNWNSLQIKNKLLKIKKYKLSKIELTNLIAMTLYKTNIVKQHKKRNFFNGKKLSNVLGAFVEVNSKMYYISEKELKQSNVLVSQQNQRPEVNSYTNQTATDVPTLIKDLVCSKIFKTSQKLLKIKNIDPNILLFHFLNITARIFIIRNTKNIFSKLINIILLFSKSQSRINENNKTKDSTK